jgi:hypothetical protein
MPPIEHRQGKRCSVRTSIAAVAVGVVVASAAELAGACDGSQDAQHRAGPDNVC